MHHFIGVPALLIGAMACLAGCADTQSMTSDPVSFRIAPTNETTYDGQSPPTQTIKQDQKGRRYVLSDTPETQVLFAVSEDQTWKKYGPVFLVAIKNKTDKPLYFVGRNILFKWASHIRPGEDRDSMAVTVNLVAHNEAANAQMAAALAGVAAGVAGSYTPAHGVNLAPAMQVVAQDIDQKTQQHTVDIAAEAGAFLDSPSALLEGTYNGVGIPPGGIMKGAVVLTGVHSKDSLYVVVEANTVNPLMSDDLREWMINPLRLPHTAVHGFKVDAF
jgi:hypothetical protein